MLSLLLDTHILAWWQSDPRRLSRIQQETLRDTERRGEPAAISAISLRELAHMGRRGVLLEKAPREVWLERLENHPLLAVLPLTAHIAAESVRLGDDFPKDPADQIIVATARCHGLRLVTADERIRRWGKVPLV